MKTLHVCTGSRPSTAAGNGMKAWLFGALLALPTLCLPHGLAAQLGDGWEILELEVSRGRLQQLLDTVEQDLAVQQLPEDRRVRLSYRATVIRKRLADGDFRAGDHVVLEVEGTPELTDTFTVASGTVLHLPVVGDVPLAGILRSELEPYLSERVAKVVRVPRVRARALVQLSILGEVTRPGFYLVTPDALLTEALMAAGGPTQQADFGKLKIERGPGSVWSPEGPPSGPIESHSVNELGLRTGDRIIIPGKGGVPKRDLIQIGILAITAFFSVIRSF